MQRSPYAVAGVQMQPGMRMSVRSHVFVPDAEAGGEDQRQQYFAGANAAKASRGPVTVRWGFAVSLTAAVFLFMAILIGSRAVALDHLRDRIHDDNEQIKYTEGEIEALKEDVADAQDIMRISYVAEQQYDMIYANRADAVPVTAPQTRYERNETYLSGSREGSPLSPDHGMISGSR